MTGIEPIAAGIGAAELAGLGNAHTTAGNAEISFGQQVTQGLKQVEQDIAKADSHLQQLALGDVENVHQTMIALEEARLHFQTLVQVRNKALEAYQDLMRMQV